MQNNNQNERVRPRLESASELKGKRAEAKKKADIKKKRLMTVISLVLVLAITVGAYFVTDALKPEEVIDDSTLPSANESVFLVENRLRSDMASMTVVIDGEEQFTVLSNLKAKAAIEEAKAAEAAAEEAGETVGDAQQDANSTAPQMLNAEPAAQSDELPAPDALGVGVSFDTPEKELQDYEIKGMPYFTTNSSEVDRMVTYSYSIVAGRLIEEGAEDLSQYGLDKPHIQVRYVYHDGTEMTLNIGDAVPVGNYYYMNLDDSADVYMVYYTVYENLARPLESLHAVPAMPVINSEYLVYLLVEQKGAETIEAVLRDSTEESISVMDVHLIQPFDIDVNTTRTSETMISAAALTLSGYADYAADEAALAQFGLAEPYAKVKVSDADGVSVEMTIGDLVAGNTGYRYATVDATGDIYTVDTSLLGFLSNCRVSYLVDQFAGLVNIKRVDGFTIETPDKTYETIITSTPYTNENGVELVHQEFTFNGQFVEEDLYRDFYTVVIGRMVDKRIENEEEYFLEGDVAMRLTYDLNYQDEPYVIEYIEYDRDYYAVRRDGVSLFLIRKEKVQEIVDTAELVLAGEYEGIDDTIDYDEVYGDSSYYE